MGISSNLIPERERLESGDSFLVDTAKGTGRLSIGAAQNQLTRNENLLDDWYFVDPIDQRRGYIVNSGVTYYSDSALTTVAGTTAAAMTVTNGTITINGTTYYVAAADVVRGYAEYGYTIDRWCMTQDINVKLAQNGITLESNTGGRHFYEFVEKEKITAGRMYTFSVLTADGELYTESKVFLDNGEYFGNLRVGEYFYHQVRFYNGQWQILLARQWNGTGTASITVAAVKLELGNQQTLAHQDASGNWVLNDPPPSKALELAKCQRYQQVFGNVILNGISTENGVTAYFQIPLATSMRACPTITDFSAGYLATDGKKFLDIALSTLPGESVFGDPANGLILGVMSNNLPANQAATLSIVHMTLDANL